MKLLKFVLVPLIVLALLAAAWIWAALSWSYSEGERAGWVQKLSKKGWLCKTWEGELSLVSLPGSTAEKFFFTVHDEAVAADITRHIGKRVALHYEEKVGLPSSCFGETRHFITKVTLTEDIPLAPGISLPNPPSPPPAAPAASRRNQAAAAERSPPGRSPLRGVVTPYAR
ncbi:MAG: hypothetical protein ACKO3M_01425 [Rubrivivax sp.]